MDEKKNLAGSAPARSLSEEAVKPNKRRIGQIYEEKAVRYLEEQGYRILERNYYCRFGELDIVAQEGSYVCFVEVKFRRSTAAGYPQQAVTRKKQQAIRRCAVWYLHEKRYREDTPCRFDVVGMTGQEIWLIRSAFGAW